MPKYTISFLELHSPLFMQGSNLGNKINAATRGAKLLMDDERNGVWIHFKQKVSLIPASNIVSMDMVEMPEDVKTALGVLEVVKEERVAPPVAIKRGPGRPPTVKDEPVIAPLMPIDPNDTDAMAKYREAVRALSANSHKTGLNPAAMTDSLIQEARNQAMGLKYPMTSKAQVQTAQEVAAGAGLTGKKKIMSHEELKAQVEAESKK